MRNPFLIILTILCYHGASGVGTDYVSAFVMEGDSVFLNTGFKTNQHVEFVWYFYHTRIAQLIGHTSKICTDVQCKEGKEEFKDRLQLDNQTGSLTISNFRTTDSGDYKLVIITNNITSKIYRIAVNGVPAAQRDEKSVVEGESVILDPGVTKNPNNSVAWYFNDTLIAEITGDQSKICTDDQCSDKFQDRLKLDHQTGSLIITNTRTTDSGLYNLKISSSSSSRYRRHRRHSVDFTRMKSFSVFVTAVPDSGLSPAAVGGACVGVLVLAAAVAGAVVIAKRKGICTRQSRQENDVL
ncbi:uncharacterized protein LOC127153853 isoform X2 [Labeo rohita]|uniref:uncharacterized protein LOC127153853 isoform X2 n=1 Tax=Labeo rohita TaxID=84645 RepID=UPI0021E1F787|nr:uncharacterized protein LOC127153853 isoform X2 [Labeo rohita]